MLQYVCDNCAVVKEPGEHWLLGFAVEQLGAVSARREIAMAPRWDENRAVQWFAVHFCSVECKDEYIAKLFGDVAVDEVEEVISAKTVTPTVKRKTTVTQSKRGTVRTSRSVTRRRAS